MRNHILKFCLFIVVISISTETIEAQNKKPIRKKTSRTTSKNKNTNRNNNNTNTALVNPPKDTIPLNKIPDADLKIEAPRPSLRTDYAFDRNLVKERTPLNYEHIREDDAAYVQRVWREVDVHEKMNLPFTYKAESDPSKL